MGPRFLSSPAPADAPEAAVKRDVPAYCRTLKRGPNHAELFPFLSLQVFALLGASLILGRPVPWFANPYFIGTAVVTLVAGPVNAACTYTVALWRTKRDLRRWFVIYACTALLYTTLKNTVAMVAMIREALGERGWVVTSRQAAAPAGRAAVAASAAE